MLKCNKHAGKNEFIDSLSPYIFFPYAFHPTRATDHSEITNDNIFFNCVSKEAICGNLTSTIYDHLPQILFIPSIFSDNPAKKFDVFEKSCANFNQAEFVMNYFEQY